MNALDFLVIDYTAKMTNDGNDLIYWKLNVG